MASRMEAILSEKALALVGPSASLVVGGTRRLVGAYSSTRKEVTSYSTRSGIEKARNIFKYYIQQQ